MRLVQSQRDVFETLRNPSSHSPSERRRAHLFLFIYVLGIVAFCLSWYHFIGTWVALMATQVALLIMTIMYALALNDYIEKHTSAMECERNVNPIVDGYIAVRVVQVLVLFGCGQFWFGLFNLTAFGIVVWRVKCGNAYVDATQLWRTAKMSEKESWVFIGTELVMIVVLVIVMVFSIIFHYA